MKTVSEAVVVKLHALLERNGRSLPLIKGVERLGDLEVDSLKIVELIFELETEFGIEVPEDEMQEIQTVNELITVIFKAVQAR